MVSAAAVGRRFPDIDVDSSLIGERVDVDVPSGRTVKGTVLGRSGDAVLVELEQNEPAVSVAAHVPGSDDLVTVLVEPPVTVTFHDLAGLDVGEGVAVLDQAGELIGLCTRTGDRTLLVEVRDRTPIESVPTPPAVSDPDVVATSP